MRFWLIFERSGALKWLWGQQKVYFLNIFLQQSDSARQHSLRVYLQMMLWKDINSSIEPTDWGWRQDDNFLMPVMSTQVFKLIVIFPQKGYFNNQSWFYYIKMFNDKYLAFKTYEWNCPK